jgi:hypothetical protein
MNYNEMIAPALLLLGGYILGKISNRWRVVRLSLERDDIKQKLEDRENMQLPDIEELSISDPTLEELEHVFFVLRKGITQRWKQEEWPDPKWPIDKPDVEA